MKIQSNLNISFGFKEAMSYILNKELKRSSFLIVSKSIDMLRV